MGNVREEMEGSMKSNTFVELFLLVSLPKNYSWTQLYYIHIIYILYYIYIYIYNICFYINRLASL